MFNPYILFVIAGVVISAFSQILLKKGAMRPHISFIRDYLNAPVIIGYGMMFLALFCSMNAYRGLEMMTVAVTEAIGFILVPILSRFFFKEKFTTGKVIGMLIIVAGVVIYNI